MIEQFSLIVFSSLLSSSFYPIHLKKTSKERKNKERDFHLNKFPKKREENRD